MEQFTDDTYILIEDYLNNTLSSDETAKVEQRIKEDTSFREEVDWMRDFMETMKDKKKAEVLEAFNKVHTQATIQKETETKRLKQFIGALILLTLIFSILYYMGLIGSSRSNINSTPTPSEANKVLPTSPVAINPPAVLPSTWQDFIVFKKGMQLLGGAGDKALEQGLILYDDNKMEEALPYLETYLAGLSPDDDDYKIRIEAGKIHLIYSKNYTKAKELFNLVIESDATSKYKLAAKFYLAISQLASGNKELAKKISQELILQNKEPWKSKSSQLLEFINR